MTNIDLVQFRRNLHAHPEIGFNLEYTANKIANVLEANGLEVTRQVGECGIVATLRRGSGDDAIGLRADMDALPIAELTNLSYASTNQGNFHGCGHDGHATMLMGAAIQLANDPDLKQTIHFIFQPDEENGNGAKAMIADGLFERFAMSKIYGLHNMPGIPINCFAIQQGSFCTFEDNFTINIKGRGGHSSMPELSIDPIVIGASIVSELQTIISRSVPAKHHAVVSVTDFKTDGARNILASNVIITGDCRGFTDDISSIIQQRMTEIVDGICSAHGASAKIDYSTSFRPLVNEKQATKNAVSAAANVGKVDDHYGPVGFSEDFAEFLLHCPGAFILMGNGTEGKNALPLHNSGYDFNDDAINHGIAYWKQLAKL